MISGQISRHEQVVWPVGWLEVITSHSLVTAALFVLELIIILKVVTSIFFSSSLWPSRSWSLSPAATLEVPPTPQTALTGSPNGPGQMPPPNKNLEKQKTKETFLRQFVHWNIFPGVQQPTINDKSAQKYVLLQDCKTSCWPAEESYERYLNSFVRDKGVVTCSKSQSEKLLKKSFVPKAKMASSRTPTNKHAVMDALQMI